MSKNIFGFSILFLLILLIIFLYLPKDNSPDLYQTILNKGNIIVGTSFDSKPFSFTDKNGVVKGIEPDLAREIFKRMYGNKVKVVFKDIVPRNRSQAILSGDVDVVISTMTITSQRKKFVSFSTPYYTSGQVICVKKNSKIDVPEDLINKKIIVILGTTGEDNIKQFIPSALIWSFVDSAQAINAFTTSSADAITTDDSLLQGLALENSNYIILPVKLTKEPYGIAFKKSKKTKLFKKQLNKIINDIITDGTLNYTLEKWGLGKNEG